MNHPTTITEDLHCAQCGYNLRTLAVDSRCPECGYLVAETQRHTPAANWRGKFRLGVGLFGVAMIVMPSVESRLWGGWQSLALTSRINSDSLVYFLHAMGLLPAAWWMTCRAPFLRRDPHRLRKIMLFLTAVQIVLGIVSTPLLHHGSYIGNIVLLSIYGVTPIGYVAELWLLLGIMIDALPVIPRALPKVVVKIVRWLLCGSLAGPMIFYGIIDFARIGYEGKSMPLPTTWLPEKWNTWLAMLLVTPAYPLQQPMLLASVLIVAYMWWRLGNRTLRVAERADNTER